MNGAKWLRTLLEKANKLKLPGKQLLDLCQNANGDVVLVAPFIKKNAIKRVLNSIPDTIRSITCVTRWRPEEVLAGVTDLEVYDLVSALPNGKLLIQPNLHAKYFRSGNRCLVGSANLTFKGLGWTTPSNLELLVEEKASDLSSFEAHVIETSFLATIKLKNELELAVQEMEKENIKYISDERCNEGADELSFDTWLPLCTKPELLYQIYTETNTERIISWTLESGQKDLQRLQIPDGLSKTNFNAFVASSLQQSPLIRIIYSRSESPISISDGRDIISSETMPKSLKYDEEEHWRTLRCWLIYFLPHIYRIPSGTDSLQRGRVIGSIQV